MGLLDWLFGNNNVNKDSKPKKTKSRTKIKSYRSKINSSEILTGNTLKTLIDHSNFVKNQLKTISDSFNEAQKLGLEAKKIEYNDGKILWDWELIKILVIKMKGCEPNIFVMNLEAIGFCEWEFGKMPNYPSNILKLLAKYWKGEIDEVKLDKGFRSSLSWGYQEDFRW